jgi:hypothetical protein
MTTHSASPTGSDRPRIEVEGATVTIHDLTIEDPSLARLVAGETDEHRPDLLRRVLETGTRGVLSMGVGIDLGELDSRVRHTVASFTAEAETVVRTLLAEAQKAIETTLDPDHRQSAMARVYAEFTAWRDEFLQQVDPGQVDGHAGRLVERLTTLLGPDGPLEDRLAEALDPSLETSAFGSLGATIDRRFTELRDLIVEERGRRREAERGTRKGFEFEDELEDALREACRPFGAIVERTADANGLTSTDSLVGDFVVTLTGGERVVIEAKHVSSIGLTGTEGILAELDRAMANRAAEVAVCVSKNDSFPREVGPFGVYGNRILVVDDGEGTMLRVALRWAALLSSTGSAGEEDIDLDAVGERLDRIRQLAQLFKANRRALTGITGSVEQVRASLDGMRSELLELLDDIDRLLRAGSQARVVPFGHQAAV